MINPTNPTNPTTLKKVPFESLLESVIPQLSRGAFLISGNPSKKLNPMTIGWCMFGQVWSRPVALVFVRESRFSHELMEENPCFGLSFPDPSDMSEALSFCGKTSGRDVDKLTNASLRTIPLQGGAFGVEGCKVHFACRRIFKLDGNLEHMDEAILRRFYKDFDPQKHQHQGGDPHTLYFGEVLSAWKAE